MFPPYFSMNLLLRLLLLLLLFPLGAEARSYLVPKENFSLGLPRHWQEDKERKVKAPWGRIALMAKGDEGRFLLVGVRELPEPTPEAALEHIQLLREPALQKGWKVSGLRETMIDSVPFFLLTITRKGMESADVLLAVTFTRERAYTIQVGDPKGSVEDVPELKEIVQSFRLLTPKTPLDLQLSPTGVAAPAPALRMRWVLAGVMGVGVVLLLLRLVIDWQAKRRRRERRRRRANAVASEAPQPTSEA
jgi:predicted Zn-dependent protease